jgi:hypothetical protein
MGGAALLAGCAVDSNYQPSPGYAVAPTSYQTYQTVQPGYQVTTYQSAPVTTYPIYSPQGSPPDTNAGMGSK